MNLRKATRSLLSNQSLQSQPQTGTSQEAVRAQIEHERMIEFPLENYRWYDLRRWGKLSSALQAAGRTGFNEDKNSFYPTPLTELNANDALK